VKFELISLTVGMRRKVRSADEEIARVAGGQHGVITRRQLLAAGLDDAAVRRREAKGLLHRVHRGVYRVGHRAPSLEARYLAAVLACGEGAVLSGLAAAHLFGLVRGWLPPAEISSHSHRRVPGIAARRVRLDRQDVTVYRGIPITTVPRTVVDLAARLGPAELARACHEAEVRHGVRAAAAQAALARRPTARGAAKLRAIFTGDAKVTLSYLERAFLTQLKEAWLPLPETNKKAGGHHVDCRWPEHRLTVELDRYRYHHTRHAWELDRRREREAHARGDGFRRFTYGDVVEDREPMLTELRALLLR
jgi:predicted transcriptional regulator of viral defense system